jgi:hypothetical protein
MPILGILASSKLIAAAGDYESIATVTVGSGGAANVEFTSIAADWTHLQIRAIHRSARAQDQDFISFRLNGDTGSNYAYHLLSGDGSSASVDAAINLTYGSDFFTTAANNTAGIFGASVIDILDYANTNKFKTIRTLSGADRNGAGRMQLHSSLWRSTSAITSIKFYSANSANLVQYSHFALYGIKGA